MNIIPPTRGTDKHGSGHYGASRGNRKHNGVDLSCYPGSIVCSTVSGKVTKLGYPYADKLQYRYVEITNSEGLKHRFFYVDPTVELGEYVQSGAPLGMVQDLNEVYPGITNHVHYEVMKGKKYIDPTVRFL